jgi:branched-subunit amino acid aminotransferase/4-amino-4-deoxychorismate lyase
MAEVGGAPLRWVGGELVPIDDCAVGETRVLAADSWLVLDGRVLAIDLHRERFLDAVGSRHRQNASAFWEASLEAVPRVGELFPRVDLRAVGERVELQLRVRPAPERTQSVVVATHRGPDPRKDPTRKGPDLESMLRLRTEAQSRGAAEAILVSPEGYVVEGAYSSLAWWRGEVLCVPSDDLERVDSVTARTLRTLATALRIDVVHEHTTASELDGLEVWSMSALQGIRIVTAWVDGPSLAERPGRLATWRRRLDALRRPLP